jgi:hypothetical protein
MVAAFTADALPLAVLLGAVDDGDGVALAVGVVLALAVVLALGVVLALADAVPVAVAAGLASLAE